MLQMPTRNSLCPCGSGRKFKRCCLVDEFEATTTFVVTKLDANLNPDTPDGRASILSYKRDLYQRWLDEPCLALGGVTPRQAAGAEDLRDGLCQELRSMEAIEAHVVTPAARMSLDFLWDELGLPVSL
jgi:hypothetical protein